MSGRGRFVSLEGIEGAGKSTLARALEAALRARGLAVLLTREPGGTPLAERLRSLLLELPGEPLAPTTETLLMFAARCQHLQQVISPALQRGALVLCDRFSDATRAYQGGGRGVDATFIEALAQAVHGARWPERTLLLDLPVAAVRARLRERGGADRFEREAPAFFERVRSRYLAIAAAEPGRVRVIDATRPAGQVLESALAALADLI
jgi:dTMP kinase